MQLQRLLFEPALVRSPLRVVRWWESRRLAYNGIVGGVGLGALAWSHGINLLFGNGPFPAPWQAIVAYGVAANVCYSFGWLVETVVERWLGRPIYGLGPALFRHGLVFSIGLTALPALLATVLNVAGRIFAP